MDRADASSHQWYDDFDSPDLDTGVWLPHYLPAWSSREASAAAWRGGSGARS